MKRSFILCAALFAAAIPLWADVVILNNGARLEGRVAPAPGNPDAILFQDYKAKLEIQRDRIQSLTEESDSEDGRRIGDQYFNVHRYQDALENYQKAIELDAENSRAREGLEAARSALTREASLDRRRQIEAIDQKIAESQRLIEEKSYDQAEKTLAEEIEALEPTAEQQSRILDLKRALYRAWALEMEDKLLEGEAARLFEKLLLLDPQDQEAYQHLIQIWEGFPERTQQVADAHRVQLKLNPGDRETRGKLADKLLQLARMQEIEKEDDPTQTSRVDSLYREAVDHYEALLEGVSPRQKQELEKRIADALKNLYARAERRGDWEQSIRLYRELQKYDRSAQDRVLYAMQYWRDIEKTPVQDADARTSLVLRLRKQGLEDLARDEIWKLHQAHPNSPTVNQVLANYAEDALSSALSAYQTGHYQRAESLASAA
ncbi:hypothetical protein HQ520_17630 [bacterium]|nr:hypothetical protein [bacterium]